MGAGVAAAGAVASLAQAGIGAYQAHKAKIAQDRAMQELRNAPKAQNMYDTMRIGNEAYAAQEAKNAQSEANMVQSFQDMGTTAALAGIPAIQQQSEMANADIAAKKAADLQQIEMMKTQQQQKTEEDYLNRQRELGMMELQGAGAARAQGNEMMWGGLGGMTSLLGSLAGNENLMTSWGLGGKKTPPAVPPTTNP